jgi:uncharacterized metal-binding protein YceD (DUF177 family)
MSEGFQISIDRLQQGHVEKIERRFPPAFLDVEEPDLSFRHVVAVKGEAYIAEDHLILHLDAETLAYVPCAICNERFDVPVAIRSFYHAEPLAQIGEKTFDFSALLREALLVELPHTAECSGGACPARERIAPYLRPPQRSDNTTYFPFADIEEK